MANDETPTTIAGELTQAYIEMGKLENAYRNFAIKTKHCEGAIEIDPDAHVEISDNGGYVQAWIFVPWAEIKNEVPGGNR